MAWRTQENQTRSHLKQLQHSYTKLVMPLLVTDPTQALIPFFLSIPNPPRPTHDGNFSKNVSGVVLPLRQPPCCAAQKRQVVSKMPRMRSMTPARFLGSLVICSWKALRTSAGIRSSSLRKSSGRILSSRKSALQPSHSAAADCASKSGHNGRRRRLQVSSPRSSPAAPTCGVCPCGRSCGPTMSVSSPSSLSWLS